jgi:hypothetical protein
MVPYDIIIELETVAESSDQDFQRKFWANYPGYIIQYNSIVERIRNYEAFKEVKYIEEVSPGHRAYMGIGSNYEQAKLREIANSSKILLKRIKRDLENPMKSAPGIHEIQILCDKFHIIANQLRHRYDKRPTLEITDEYDVQDLMHSLLLINFDDVRPEEWTPSYAGGSSIMDFLLKKEKIVIEVKKIRKGLGAKELSDQLIIDIDRYKNHPDCKMLICFVYDLESKIANPRGIERDIEEGHFDLPVKVLIRPTGH